MSGKRKQIVIPQTNTTRFAEMTKKELRDWCKYYYSQNFIGKNVRNLDLGIDISLQFG